MISLWEVLKASNGIPVDDPIAALWGNKLSAKKKVVYGWHIDPDESDPESAVTYLEDAVGMTPAKMTADGFDYGSWAGAFFMPKPCMLKFDGTVDYYLDPIDYSKKADGTPSDYNNLAYEGNVMLEFPKIWYKFVAGEAAGEGYFYVSNRKIDDTYHCWCNYDSLNREIDHFYMAAYNGCIYDGKLRSISGLKLTPWSTTAYSASSTYAVGAKVHNGNNMYECVTAVTEAEPFDPEKWEQFAYNGMTDGTQEVNAALAMNTKSSPEWYIGVLADRQLVTGLLTLMSKSLDSQGKFGRGIDSGSQASKEAYITGSLDDKGLFYGSTTNGSTAVKVFGMENFWACCWHRTAGLVGASNGYRYKLTYGTADGSEATSYNSNGANYNLLVSTRPSFGYFSKMVYGDHGFMPLSVSGGSASKYYCDYYYNGNGFALFGGSSPSGAYGGVWYFSLYAAFGNRNWGVAASPSCKPLA